MQRKIMAQLRAHGIRPGVSDIHLEPGDRPAYRIDGSLRVVAGS